MRDYMNRPHAVRILTVGILLALAEFAISNLNADIKVFKILVQLHLFSPPILLILFFQLPISLFVNLSYIWSGFVADIHGR